MQNKYYSYKGKTVSQASQDHHSYTPAFQVTRTPSSPGQHSQNKLPCKIDLTLALDFRKLKTMLPINMIGVENWMLEILDT